MSDSEPWDFYLAETVGNSFYWASELVTTASMVRLASSSANGRPEDFGRLFDLATTVAADITELFQHIVADLLEAMNVEAVGIDVGEPARVSALPFFLSDDDLRQFSTTPTDSQA